MQVSGKMEVWSAMEKESEKEDRGRPAHEAQHGSQIEGPEPGSEQMHEIVGEAEDKAEQNVEDRDRSS